MLLDETYRSFDNSKFKLPVSNHKIGRSPAHKKYISGKLCDISESFIHFDIIYGAPSTYIGG
jgi:hypothetical protein